MTGRTKWASVSLAVLVGLACVGPVWAAGAPASQAKDIFYNPAEVPVVEGQPQPPDPPVQIALNYRILLWRKCQLYQVNSKDFVFRSGDKFRIAFQSNMNGFLNIFHRGSTAKCYKLFPDPRINAGSSKITKYCELVVPASGWFEFDPNPGQERLYIFLSPKPVDALNFGGTQQPISAAVWEQATAPYFKQVAEAKGKGAAKDIVFVDDGQTVAPQPPPPGQTVAPPPNANPQTFVATQVSPQAAYDPMLIHDLTLMHR